MQTNEWIAAIVFITIIFLIALSKVSGGGSSSVPYDGSFTPDPGPTNHGDY